MDISIVTSFNEKISRNPHTQTLTSAVAYNPEIPTYVYHENSYDSKTYGKKIEFSTATAAAKVYPLDLFKCWDKVAGVKDDWFEDFVAGPSSPFKKGKGYWNSHSRFWFRKIASIYHCSKLCNTRYLLWLDSDITFRRRSQAAGIDSEFFEFIKKYDMCLVNRPERHRGKNDDALDEWRGGSPPDTGIVCFDLHNDLVIQFIDNLFEYFVNGSVFSNEVRWDDSYVIGRLLTNQYSDTFKIGVFRNRYSGTNSENTSAFDIFNDYFSHHKHNKEHRVPDRKFLSDEEFAEMMKG